MPGNILRANVDAIGGGVLGAVSSLLVTAGVAPGISQTPDGLPPWVGYAGSALIAIAPMALRLLRDWFRGEAAGDRVRAARQRDKATKLRAAGKMAEAQVCDDLADELEAQAAEKEAKAKGGQ